MYKRVAQKLAEAAINRRVIPSDDKAMVIYAYETMLARILGWGTLLIFGIIFHRVLGAIAFIIMFFPLRIFAGGYHARNYEKCYMTSSITFAIMTIGSRYFVLDINPLIIIIIVVACLTAIQILAPIGDENKPLDQSEQAKYGFIAKLIATFEAIAIILMTIAKINWEIVLFSVFALSLEALLLMVAKWQVAFSHRS